MKNGVSRHTVIKKNREDEDENMVDLVKTFNLINSNASSHEGRIHIRYL